MSTKIINPSADPRWDNFVYVNENGSVYHHSAWKDVLGRSYKQLQPFYFILEDRNGEIEAGIATFFVKSWLTGKRLVSLPFSSYGDPLIENPNKAEELMGALLTQGKNLKVDYIEFRLSRLSKPIESFQGDISKRFVTHILPLDRKKEELFGSFHTTSVKQRIKQAEKKQLKLVIGKSQKDMDQFYRLHLMTRKKHGLPCQPHEFFENMWEILSQEGMLTLLLAGFSGNIVAATILLKYKNTVYSEYSASDDRFLNLHPNHWLLWKAIEMAKAEGYEYFDFGRSSIGNKGLIDFKMRWGGIQYSLNYSYYPKSTKYTSSAENTFKYRILTDIIKYLPFKMNEWSGRLLYKHLGG